MAAIQKDIALDCLIVREKKRYLHPISMFNMEKSIYKDHFRISCSKILSIVVILQCPKMNSNGIIVLFRMRIIILSNVTLPLCLKGIYQIQKILPLKTTILPY